MCLSTASLACIEVNFDIYLPFLFRQAPTRLYRNNACPLVVHSWLRYRLALLVAILPHATSAS